MRNWIIKIWVALMTVISLTGNGVYIVSADDTAPIILQGENEITEENPARVAMGSSLTLSSSDSTPVQWHSNSWEIYRMNGFNEDVTSGSITITTVTPGKTTIRAGGVDYPLMVTGYGIDIPNTGFISMKIGETLTKDVLFQPEDPNQNTQRLQASLFTWTSDDPTIAEVNADTGAISAVKEGTTIVRAVLRTDSSVSVTTNVTVRAVAAESISLNVSSATLTGVSETEQLSVIYHPDNTSYKDITWSSSDDTKVEVSEDGLITAKQNTSEPVTIKAVLNRDTNKFATCSVVVGERVTGISLDQDQLELKPGTTGTLEAVIEPETAVNKKVHWAVSGEAITLAPSEDTLSATVTGVKAGSATVTAASEDGGFSATCTVTVSEADFSLVPAQSALILKNGSAETAISVNASESVNGTWSVEPSNVASIDATTSPAKLTVTGNGIVRVKLTDNAGQFATCEVTVSEESSGFDSLVRKLKAGNNVVLSQDIAKTAADQETSSYYVVADGKTNQTVVLDLNGHNISFEDIKTKLVVKNNNTLIIKNSASGNSTFSGHAESMIAGVEGNGHLSVQNVHFSYPYLAIANSGNESGTVDIANCHFTGTSDNSRSVTSSNGEVTITDSVFENNLGLNCEGSAVSAEKGNLTISRSVFQNNRSNNGGAVKFYGSKLSIADTTFSGNTSAKDGGSVYVYNSSDVELKNCTFENNSSTNSGGAVAVFHNDASVTTKVNIEECTFRSNHAGKNGGALFVRESELKIDPTVIENNTSDGDGGGIYVEEKTTLNLPDDSVVSLNTAKGRGGGLYAGNSTVNITGGVRFENNRSDFGTADQDKGAAWNNGGGAIQADATDLTISAGVYKDNSAWSGGGAVLFAGGSEKKLEINGGTFTNNYAETHEGGAVSIASGEAIITAGTFTENRSGYIKATGKINPNYADWGGGAIFVSDKAEYLYIPKESGARITNNSALGFGGGVASCATGRTFVYRGASAIYGNTAQGTNTSGSGSDKHEDHDALNAEVFMTGGYQDFFSARSGFVSNEMFGGDCEMWRGSADGHYVETDDVSDYIVSSDRVGLTSANTSPSGVTNARVVITGNFSATHGGGILNNGIFLMGSGSEKIVMGKSLRISANKILLDKDGNEYPSDNQYNGHAFKFEVFDITDGEPGTFRMEGVADEEHGGVYFANTLVFDKTVWPEGIEGLSSDGKKEKTFRFKIVETGETAGVLYDQEPCYVEVDAYTHLTHFTVNGNTLDKYNYYISAIRVKKGDGEFKTVSEPYAGSFADESHATVIDLKDYGDAFVNKEAETTSLSVVKVWDDNNNADHLRPTSIKVRLISSESSLDQTVTLSEKNNWKHTFADLPTVNYKGETIDYDIKELDQNLKVAEQNDSPIPEYSVSYLRKDNVVTITNHHPKKVIRSDGTEVKKSKPAVHTGDPGHVREYGIGLASALLLMICVIFMRRRARS